MPPDLNRRLSARLRSWRGTLAAVVALGTSGELAFCGALAVFGHVTAALAFRGIGVSRGLVPSCALLFGLLAAFLACAGTADRLARRAATGACAVLRGEMADKLVRLGPQALARQPAGQLAVLFTDAIEALQPYFRHWIPNAAAMVCVPLCLVVALLPLDWVTAALLLVCGPLVPVFMVLVGYRAQEVMDRQWSEMLRLSSALLDRLRGLAMLELFGRVREELDALSRMAERHRVLSLRVMRIGFLTSAVLEFFASLSIAMVAVFFAARLLGGSLRFERAFIALLIVPRFFAPLRAFSASYHTRMNALSAFERVEAFLHLPEPDVATADHRFQGPIRSIGCRDLSVRLDGESVFAPVSARFEAGTLTVLTGRSGAGKTSLLRALLGFLPHEGAVLLNDAVLPASAPADPDPHPGSGLVPALRHRLAWLPQTPHLIAGSIRDNLLLSAPDADPERLREAARAAQVLDEIEALPRGFDEPVGDDGSCLSGGQAQRVALARALLKRPDILLLDEPTAHVDPASAVRVLDTLLALRRHCIVVVATHDEAIVSRADRRIALLPDHDASRVAA